MILGDWLKASYETSARAAKLMISTSNHHGVKVSVKQSLQEFGRLLSSGIEAPIGMGYTDRNSTTLTF
jgi:hypothetical protein